MSDHVPAPPDQPLDRDPRVRRALARSERAATGAVLRLLRARIGVRRTIGVLLRVLRDRLRGEPFAVLGPPCDARDRLSRQQAAGLVLLDRHVGAIERDLGAEVCRVAVDAGAGLFLSEMIPFRTADELLANAALLAARFFNAEGHTALAGDELRFTVERCRFTELLPAVGAAHLQALFCAADFAFFDREGAQGERLITLGRTQTRAEGAPSCDFRFTLRSPRRPA